MITYEYSPLFDLIIKIKNKSLKRKTLQQFDQDKRFRKCRRKMITNLVRRKNELENKNKLKRFNGRLLWNSDDIEHERPSSVGITLA